MLTEEQKLLVENNMALVNYIIRKRIHIGQDDYEDLFQEGCYYLCKAALDFNPDLGFQFSTYAGSLIWGGISKYKKFNSFQRHGIKVPRNLLDIDHKIKSVCSTSDYDIENKEDMQYILECLGVKSYIPLETVSMQTEIHDNEGHIGTCLGDLIPDVFKGYEEVELNCYIEDLLNKFRKEFGERSYNIIVWLIHNYLSYGDTFTQLDIANTWGISQGQVSRILKRCKKIIREMY